MTDYDYHAECEEGNHADGHGSAKYTRVLYIRSHAFIRYLKISYQMSINSGAPPSGHLPDPYAPLVNALIMFHKRIKRDNFHPRNMLLKHIDLLAKDQKGQTVLESVFELRAGLNEITKLELIKLIVEQFPNHRTFKKIALT